MFARALAEYFNGEIYYLPIENHFITKIGDEFYDIRGLLSGLLETPIQWSSYKTIDCLEWHRIMRDCIKNKQIL